MNIRPKKSLGQNFLRDETVLGRIIKNANLSKEDVVVEVGPGKGALTDLLSGVCKKVIAIELDQRLVDMLQEKFKDTQNVEIVYGDILKINLPELIAAQELTQCGYKVVANLPYYITSPIIRLFLETLYPASEMMFMVQKEVAERIAAKPGAMSILAVSVQYYAKAQFLFTVFKQSFDPVPKVDSAIIKISRNITIGQVGNKQETISKEEVKKFFRIVRAGFSAKRKTLENNLSNGLHLEKKEVLEKIESIGFEKNTRAQELGVEDWKKLGEFL